MENIAARALKSMTKISHHKIKKAASKLLLKTAFTTKDHMRK
jgi:hypothetical protein